jgi:hypothetical protein
MSNYRVIFRDGQYAVHQVFYGDDGRITGYTQDPVFPGAGTLEELAAELRRCEAALNEPLLDYAELQSEAERRRQTTG